MPLRIDISFSFRGQEFSFKALVQRGEPFTFEIGEKMLADKLFYTLVGLDRDYRGIIEGEGVNFSMSRENNVLGLGDGSMFIRGSARRNIYKAFRVRERRKVAKRRTDEVMKIYDVSDRLGIALARAHYREVELVVINAFDSYISKIPEKNFTKYRDGYIIVIS